MEGKYLIALINYCHVEHAGSDISVEQAINYVQTEAITNNTTIEDILSKYL